MESNTSETLAVSTRRKRSRISVRFDVDTCTPASKMAAAPTVYGVVQYHGNCRSYWSVGLASYPNTGMKLGRHDTADSSDPWRDAKTMRPRGLRRSCRCNSTTEVSPPYALHP